MFSRVLIVLTNENIDPLVIATDLACTKNGKQLL